MWCINCDLLITELVFLGVTIQRPLKWYLILRPLIIQIYWKYFGTIMTLKSSALVRFDYFSFVFNISLEPSFLCSTCRPYSIIMKSRNVWPKNHSKYTKRKKEKFRRWSFQLRRFTMRKSTFIIVYLRNNNVILLSFSKYLQLSPEVLASETPVHSECSGFGSRASTEQFACGSAPEWLCRWLWNTRRL
jgi:hypothetical protein